MSRYVLSVISLAVVFAVPVSAQDTPAEIPRAQQLALSVLEIVTNEIERLTLQMQESDGWDEELGQALAANMRIMALVVDDAFVEALETAISEVGGEGALAAEIMRGEDFEGLQALQALGGGEPMTEDEIRGLLVGFRENGLSEVFEGLGSPGSTTDPQRP